MYIKHRQVMKQPILSPSVYELVDIQTHRSTKIFHTHTQKKTKNSLLMVKVSYLISGCTVLYFGQKKKKSNCSVSVIRESSPRKRTRIKVPNQWPTWRKYHIVNKWPSMYRFRIRWANYALGSVVSAVPPLPPT